MKVSSILSIKVKIPNSIISLVFLLFLWNLLGWHWLIKLYRFQPWPSGLFGWVLSRTTEGCGFKSQWGHISGLRGLSLIRAPFRGDQSIFLSHIDLSFSLPSSSSEIKHILGWGLKKLYRIWVCNSVSSVHRIVCSLPQVKSPFISKFLAHQDSSDEIKQKLFHRSQRKPREVKGCLITTLVTSL